ncbi:uncharacterized protein J7T55_003313 [Diaporthe amygdali]|uniref:uncharacterized protein n=1 Tax=Phomopsis amygdali TaxID=1214568 RepID=UPI0022FE8809|nr:uncharacterized protein J7T55_003313 [Diaporthe amygdali]KAJ0116899.1 uncharacterized protein J7T55_003313 [Diaporthe amygdali]
MEESALEKRRRQNRDSQRRFSRASPKPIHTVLPLSADAGQKHAKRTSDSNPRATAAAFPVWPPLSPSESLLQNHNNNNTFFETTNNRAYSQHSVHQPLMRGNVFQELELRDELHRPPPESTRPSSNAANINPCMPIPPLDSYSGIGADKSLGYPQQSLSLNTANRSTRGGEQPPSAIDHSPSADSYTPAYSQPPRRPPGRTISNAECMITRVEQLYEVGVDIGILPEDPALPSSLHKMKARFRSVTSDRYTYDDELDDLAMGGLEDSSQDGGSY